MDLFFEAVRALGLIAAMVLAVFLAPLIFMIVFSLVSGFDERVTTTDRHHQEPHE